MAARLNRDVLHTGSFPLQTTLANELLKHTRHFTLVGDVHILWCCVPCGNTKKHLSLCNVFDPYTHHELRFSSEQAANPERYLQCFFSPSSHPHAFSHLVANFGLQQNRFHFFLVGRRAWSLCSGTLHNFVLHQIFETQLDLSASLLPNILLGLKGRDTTSPILGRGFRLHCRAGWCNLGQSFGYMFRTSIIISALIIHPERSIKIASI